MQKLDYLSLLGLVHRVRCLDEFLYEHPDKLSEDDAARLSSLFCDKRSQNRTVIQGHSHRHLASSNALGVSQSSSLARSQDQLRGTSTHRASPQRISSGRGAKYIGAAHDVPSLYRGSQSRGVEVGPVVTRRVNISNVDDASDGSWSRVTSRMSEANVRQVDLSATTTSSSTSSSSKSHVSGTSRVSPVGLQPVDQRSHHVPVVSPSKSHHRSPKESRHTGGHVSSGVRATPKSFASVAPNLEESVVVRAVGDECAPSSKAAKSSLPAMCLSNPTDPPAFSAMSSICDGQSSSSSAVASDVGAAGWNPSSHDSTILQDGRFPGPKQGDYATSGPENRMKDVWNLLNKRPKGSASLN